MRIQKMVLLASALSSLAIQDAAAQESPAERVARESQVPEGQTASIAPRIEPDARTGEIIASRRAKLAALTHVTEEMLTDPDPEDWLQWRRTYDAQGFSPLTEIAKGNVSDLRTSWAWSLPSGSSEISPLVHDGVLFVYGAGDQVHALDARTGDLLWRYARRLPEGVETGGTAGLKKSFALHGDRLYLPTADSHLIALDIRTGEEVWDHAFPDSDDFRMTAGPVIANGVIVQGTGGCPSGGCHVIGLDVESGEELWRFNTVAQPGKPGDSSWNGLPGDQRFGASVWMTGSYDPELDLVYIGTGNTYAWQHLHYGGPNKLEGNNKDGLYVNSTLALRPKTGELVWHYQHMPEDPWDLDVPFERQLADLMVDGVNRRVIFTTGKTVITDVLDAATGEWIFSLDQGIQNVVSSIDPETGVKTYDPATIPDLTRRRRNLQCPAGYGAKNWPSNSFDPRRNMLYITIAEVCGESLPREWKPGDPYSGGGMETRIARYQPGSDGNIGRVDAIDMDTRTTAWSTRQRASVTSAALATAGGVMFAGDADRHFKAYDSDTGDVLWQVRLNDAVNSYPISYGVDGEQYVAVVAGTGGPRIGNLRQLTQEIESPAGDSAVLWVFKMPEGNP